MRSRAFLEVLSVVATEALVPNRERRCHVARTLLPEAASWVSGVASLAQLWAQYSPPLNSLFQ